MDLSDLNKVANRKRMTTDAEKLREKMSRESTKIIKLRVAQDTAYWDMKERFSGMEAEHERLQQNMLDMQMEHEKLSAQYQEELRLRPETLNKLGSTREICDVLEEYAGRVRASLRRAGADRAALAESYAGAARRVQAAHAQHARAAEHAHMHVAALNDKLRLSSEHGARLADMAGEARRQLEALDGAARAQLHAAAERADDLRNRYDALAERAAVANAALQERERTIAELKREAERRAAESSAEFERASKIREELQKEVESLRSELSSAQARSETSARECERALQALAVAEERGTRLSEETVRLTLTVQNLETIGAELKRELEAFGAKNEALQKEIDEKVREIHENTARLEGIQRELKETRAARDETAVRLRSALSELETERQARATEASTAAEEIQKLVARNAAATAASERELSERADTVSQLMRDVAAEAGARARAEAALHAAREQLDDTARDRDQLNNKLQTKEKELAGQMKIILEIRSEKERLQDIIRGMQGTIDNIQKELTREPPPAAAAAVAASATRREPPEHDDNARPPPSTPLKQGVFKQPPKGGTDKGVFLSPRTRPADDLLYHFLSDSSIDGDVIDSDQVNARFEALSRGAVPPPTSLQALKRRRDHPRALTPATRPCPEGDDDLSMSQVKAELAARGRSFFRNKRLDVKPKKAK